MTMMVDSADDNENDNDVGDDVNDSDSDDNDGDDNDLLLLPRLPRLLLPVPAARRRLNIEKLLVFRQFSSF